MESTKKKKSEFDFLLLLAAIGATIYGIVIICSATNSFTNTLNFMIVQIVALLIGLAGVFLISRLDYEVFGTWAFVVYGVVIVLMILVLLIGQDSTGTARWIRYGPIGFQPSEIAKIGFIITIARHAASVKSELNHPKNVLALLAHATLPVVLLLRQPDLGTAICFIFMFIGVMFFAGISFKYILSALGVLAVTAPLAWIYVLNDYQRTRIFTFLNPEADLSGAGYHVMQSKIAVGSGQITGKGLFAGSQTQFGFLPEKQTDFIFAVAGEELGFIGVMAIILILVFIIFRIMMIAGNAGDDFGELICIGTAFMIAFHMIENVCMCIGLTPVTGIPLPFFSYGGSNLLTNFISLALVLNVSLAQKRT